MPTEALLGHIMGKLGKQVIPSDHARHLCIYHKADEATVTRAIDGALAGWEALPWGDRAAIFLKTADLISKKCRNKLLTDTIPRPREECMADGYRRCRGG